MHKAKGSRESGGTGTQEEGNTQTQERGGAYQLLTRGIKRGVGLEEWPQAAPSLRRAGGGGVKPDTPQVILLWLSARLSG